LDLKKGKYKPEAIFEILSQFEEDEVVQVS
jgi:hypothetical protein